MTDDEKAQLAVIAIKSAIAAAPCALVVYIFARCLLDVFDFYVGIGV